ncbi:MAG TPA: Sec-independent protein translocase protein TatB [Micropepsaceae bacterium]|nr:Sec-independent protein translocase protein TatB [Micropepsaceae bacterium]
MFGIDGSEYLVILIVALVVVGPKDLPKLMRKIGQWAGRARAMADQFRRSFDDMARQAELDELRNEVNKMKAQAEKATQPITEADYAALGIEFPKDPLGIQSTIEEVGAAPPKFDEPAPSMAEATPKAAPSAAASGIAPAPSAEEPAKLEPSHTGTTG